MSWLLALPLSLVLCGAFRWLALRRQWLDQPNARSSHQLATPSGAGVAIIAAFVITVAVSLVDSHDWTPAVAVVCMAAVLLALLGMADDLWSLSVGGRFFAYGMLAALVTGVLLQQSMALHSLRGALVLGAVALGMLWHMNLYNFMDGIDGLAAVQAFITAATAGLLSWVYGGSGSYAVLCFSLAFAHLGFLAWNWQPARLFMGDAGSIATGFLLAALALLGWRDGDLPPACWLILVAPFIADATVTLLQRLWRRENVTRAHRSHAYQILAQRWGSHRAVVFLLLALHAFWLFPLAWLARLALYSPVILVILAYLPLLLGVVLLRKNR